MSTPAAKKRRLDASKTLHKPFKSPFRTPLKPASSSDPPSSDPPDVYTPSNTTSITNSTATSVATPALRSSLPTPSRPPVSRPASRPLQKQKAPSKPSLTREIMQTRNDIQILSQALTLATSSKDADLDVLIERWRTASRAAAEALFANTRDRVNRMGGVGAWRDREREQKDWRMKREIEEMEAERERMAEEREERADGAEEYEDVDREVGQADGMEEQEKEDVGADDDTFTMDMMLKTLNIDLELIGYNKEAQRWDG